MARIEIVLFKCDMADCATPEEDVQTQPVQSYRVIDLCATHRAEWETAIAPFLNASRKSDKDSNVTSIKAAKSYGSTRKNSPEYNEKVRAWAKRNELKCNERGRIPTQIITAYENNDPSLAASFKVTPAVPEVVKPATKVPAQKKTTAKKATPKTATTNGDEAPESLAELVTASL